MEPHHAYPDVPAPPGPALVVATLAVIGCTEDTRVSASAPELSLPDTAPTVQYDFEGRGVDGWAVVEGAGTVEETAGAPRGTRALVQRATRNEFDVIVTPAGPFTDADVSVRFRPISGPIDAPGGIVGGLSSALTRGGTMWSGQRAGEQLPPPLLRSGAPPDRERLVPAPALGQWHTARVVVGDRIQGYAEGRLRTKAVG